MLCRFTEQGMQTFSCPVKGVTHWNHWERSCNYKNRLELICFNSKFSWLKSFHGSILDLLNRMWMTCKESAEGPNVSCDYSPACSVALFGIFMLLTSSLALSHFFFILTSYFFSFFVFFCAVLSICSSPLPAFHPSLLLFFLGWGRGCHSISCRACCFHLINCPHHFLLWLLLSFYCCGGDCPSIFQLGHHSFAKPFFIKCHFHTSFAIFVYSPPFLLRLKADYKI